MTNPRSYDGSTVYPRKDQVNGIAVILRRGSGQVRDMSLRGLRATDSSPVAGICVAPRMPATIVERRLSACASHAGAQYDAAFLAGCRQRVMLVFQFAQDRQPAAQAAPKPVAPCAFRCSTAVVAAVRRWPLERLAAHPLCAMTHRQDQCGDVAKAVSDQRPRFSEPPDGSTAMQSRTQRHRITLLTNQGPAIEGNPPLTSAPNQRPYPARRQNTWRILATAGVRSDSPPTSASTNWGPSLPALARS
ncbi:MAG: hypothetical protein JWR11_2989 [Mycobacterium sp.]|nr:hypothetical protein [Mycobacterium sp.]MDT5180852.1 hypothetical protein [Mycobacterium sp.]